MRLMPTTRSHSLRMCGAPSLLIVRTAVPVPAQLMPTRSGADSEAIATPSATCSALVTSALKNFVAPPSSLASASPFSALKSRIVTSAPPAANRRTVASPRPDAPPLTIAAAPLMSMGRQPKGRARDESEAPVACTKATSSSSDIVAPRSAAMS